MHDFGNHIAHSHWLSACITLQAVGKKSWMSMLIKREKREYQVVQPGRLQQIAGAC